MRCAMSDTDNAVIAWLHGQQDWLQSAAAMILEKGALDDGDIHKLAERLKTPEGRRVTSARTFAGLAETAAQTAELRLVSVGPVEGVERLAPREPLTFGDGNLTVIFGLNGSGKSGYARILKRACGKLGAKALRSNVYTDPPTRRQCTITFKLGSADDPPVWTDRPTAWNADGEAIDDLRNVDFFDEDTGLVYLTTESVVAYEPPAIALLRELAQVCTRIRNLLKTEQDGLARRLPTMPSEHADTILGRRYVALTADTTPEQVQELTKWSGEDETELQQLGTRLLGGDPAAQARKKHAARTQVLALAGVIASAAKACSDGGLSAIRLARKTAAGKRKAAVEAAGVAAGTAILDGVGSDTWRAMWQAARNYSTLEAYRKLDFPVVSNNAVCVLCHQTLSGEATQRFLDFEKYVQGALESEATAAEAVLAGLLEELPDDLEGEAFQLRCAAAGLADGDPWLGRVVELGKKAAKSIARLRENEATGTAEPLRSPVEILDELNRRARVLEADADRLARDATPEGAAQRAADTQRLTELRARKWISEQKTAVAAEVDRLDRVASLERLRSLANSAPVSRKATETSENIVTQAYADRFTSELKALTGFHRWKLKVELHKTRADIGQVLYQLRLSETKDRTERPAEILSEGERRVISLAAFLADVAQKPHAAPFVFDDPISSLDHEFEENVARRLASLAKTRQVLVFTHRLSLLNLLSDAAGKASVSNSLAGISAYAGTTGHADNSAAWTGKTAKFNQHLLERAHRAKKAGDEYGPGDYKGLARGVCTDFRRLLERTVEDDLLNEIVRRHRHEVHTKNKLSALTKIEQGDCDLLDGLMTKYSKYLHSQSVEEFPDPPEPNELIGDIQGLAEWRKGFGKRIG